MKIILQILYGFSLLFFSLPKELFGQDNVYNFNHLSVENGLTSGQYNYYVHQDNEGFVWVSSVMGLNRFDGKQVKNYHSNAEDPYALKHEFAAQSKFQEARNGELWFTNNVCLTRYERTSDQFFHHQFVKPNGDLAKTRYFWSYLDSETGNLFTTADKLLFALNIHDPDKKFYVDSVSVDIKDRMAPAPNGGYFLFRFGYGDSILQIRLYNNFHLQKILGYFPTPDGSGINDIIYTGDDSFVWIATTSGLFKLNISIGKWETVSSRYEQKVIKNIIEIAERPSGEFIVATQNQGVYFFNPSKKEYTGQVRTFRGDKIVPFNSIIERMTLDNKENLWIYVKDDGVYYTCLDKPKFNLLKAGLGNGKNSYKAIAEGKDGVVWALYTARPQEVKSWRVPILLATKPIKHVLSDNQRS